MVLVDVCNLCRQDLKWHEIHKPHHEFQSSTGSSSGASSLQSKDSERSGKREERHTSARIVLRNLGADPVLRAAMILAGAIREDDLLEMENIFLQGIEEHKVVKVSPRRVALVDPRDVNEDRRSPGYSSKNDPGVGSENGST